jgi:hypothetical protein
MTAVATKSEAAATSATDLTENPSDFHSDCTSEARAVSYMIRELSGSDLEHLIPLLQAQRERLKTVPTHEEAMHAFECAPIKAWSEQSPHADALRVRVACRVLISERGWRPEQIESAMLVIAYQVSCHSRVAAAAVAEGIKDGMAILKARAANG